MPVTAAPVIPTLADRLAFATTTGEPDRDPHPGGQGAPNASNSGAMPTATRFNQLSRLSCFIVLSPFKLPAWAMASAIGPASWRTPGGEGAAGICRGGAGAAQRATARLIAVAGRGGRRSTFPCRSNAIAGDAGDLRRACPPTRAIVTRMGRDAEGCSIGTQRR